MQPVSNPGNAAVSNPGNAAVSNPGNAAQYNAGRAANNYLSSWHGPQPPRGEWIFHPSLDQPFSAKDYSSASTSTHGVYFSCMLFVHVHVLYMYIHVLYMYIHVFYVCCTCIYMYCTCIYSIHMYCPLFQLVLFFLFILFFILGFFLFSCNASAVSSHV